MEKEDLCFCRLSLILCQHTPLSVPDSHMARTALQAQGSAPLPPSLRDAVSYVSVVITLILLSSKPDENPSPEAIGKDRNGRCR